MSREFTGKLGPNRRTYVMARAEPTSLYFEKGPE
jgi:hypothetical protein